MPRLTAPLLLSILALAACNKNQPPPKPPASTQATEEPVAEGPKADPIPAGWFALTPQIAVTDVDAAIEFYVTAFGAEKVMAMPGPDGKTMHGEVKFGDSLLMIDAESDGLKAPSTIGGTPMTLMIYTADADAVWAKATEAGATVQMPLEEQFWGDRYGEMLDPFGHRWAIGMHVTDLTPEEMQQRTELAMAEMPKPGAKKKKSKKKKEPGWKKIAGTPATQAIAPDYHTLNVSIVVTDAAKAIEFYTKAFGAVERERVAGPEGKLMHAEVKIGDTILMMSDEMEFGPKSATTLGASSAMIHHYVVDVDGVFAKAKGEGAREILAVTDMFWGDRYGALIDPGGMPWGVATHKEDLTPEQMNERMKAQMGGTPPAEGTPPADAPPPAPAT